jgi:hypothetical protein
MRVVIDAQRHQFGRMRADDLDLSRHIDLQLLEVLQQMRGDRVIKTDDSNSCIALATVVRVVLKRRTNCPSVGNRPST